MTRKYTTLPYTEYPVATGNFDKTRKPITQIIIHSTVSKYESAIAWFGNPKAGTSAHYVIANDGRLAAMLEEYYTAYHSGNYGVNQSSIGIEHEWYSGLTLTDKLYATSAKLVADICKYYNIPCNRGTVKGHNEITATGCPNGVGVDRIVKEAQAILTPPVTDPCANLRLEFKATEKRLIEEKDRAIKDKEVMIGNLKGELERQKGFLKTEQSANESKRMEIVILKDEITALKLALQKADENLQAKLAEKDRASQLELKAFQDEIIKLVEKYKHG